MKTDNMIYHKECFTCYYCQKEFNYESYIEEKSNPYHLQCYKKKFLKKCAFCNQFCEDKFYNQIEEYVSFN